MLSRSMFCMIVSMAITGCSLFSASPTSLIVDLTADKDVNPNADGVATPVVVRLDVLRSKDAYVAAEFTPLYTKSKTLLAADLVSSNEAELRPGDMQTITIDDAKDGTELGVLAAYRDIDTAKWRYVYDLRKGATNKITVHLGLGAVEVAKKRGGFWFLW